MIEKTKRQIELVESELKEKSTDELTERVWEMCEAKCLSSLRL